MKQQIYLALITVLLGVTITSHAQNAFYHAIKIDYFNKLYKQNPEIYKNKLGEQLENFTKFTGDPFNNKIDSATLDIVAENVIVDEFGNAYPNEINTLQKHGLQSIFFSSIPVSSQSAIIDGTAKFIAERFKEEVTTMYLDKFRRRLDSIPELQALYPKTYSFFKSADVFNYRALGNDFKEAFEEDLRNILANLQTYINSDENLKNKLKENKVYYPFDYTLALSDKLVNGYHPVEILDFLDNTYKNKPGFQDYYNVTHGLNIIQQNLQRKEKISPSYELNPQFKNVWLRFSELSKIDRPERVEYFLALIYHQDPGYFTSYLKISAKDTEDFFKNTIYPIASVLNNIENIQAKGKLTGDDYVGVMTNTLKLLKYVDEKSGKHLSIIQFNDSNDSLDVLEFIDKVVDLYKSVYTKDYGYVVTNSLYVTEKVLLASGKTKVEIVETTQAISQYGGFMVDVVTAENSDDVKEAIKKNVTKHTYLDKRNSLVNFTLTAHPGVYASSEYLVESEKWSGNVGITAPIGFELMWGYRTSNAKNKDRYPFIKNNSVKYLTGGAWSIFASFADIGAVFNFRLNDTESQLPQEFTFKQVFSPGLSLNHAFRNSPLTFGIGVQYTPELRSVTIDDVKTSTGSIRLMGRLSWDIPLMKIGSKNIKR